MTQGASCAPVSSQAAPIAVAHHEGPEMGDAEEIHITAGVVAAQCGLAQGIPLQTATQSTSAGSGKATSP